MVRSLIRFALTDYFEILARYSHAAVQKTGIPHQGLGSPGQLSTLRNRVFAGPNGDLNRTAGVGGEMHNRPARCIVSRQRLRNLLFIAIIAASSPRQFLDAQSCANPVACENQQQGDTDWQVSGAGDSDIQGFATDISVNAGGTVFFKIKTNASAYHLDIYRMGYYGGAGARKITTITPSVSLPQTQPACLTDSQTGLADCGNWSVSASWNVPPSAVSGIYFAHLIRDNGDDSQIFWIVRNDSSHSDILFQTSDQTWQAYNDYGGHSLYGGPGTWNLNDRAFKVSYNRPFDTRSFEAASFVFNAEYPMIRWLESNGYDVSYFTGVDAARSPALITNHRLYLSVGHDEYVSTQARANIQAARDAGVNLGYFSGNEVFWKTRWENSIDGTNTPYRTMVCYKETYYGTPTLYVKDPADPGTWTGTWADPRFSPPADGGQPQNALTGTLFSVNGPGSDNTNLAIQVTADDGKLRFWRNTSMATLGAGQTANLPAGTLGYEWDSDIDNGFRPAGAVPLSTSNRSLTADLLLDYGGTYGGGDTTHRLVLYRAASGALVFGAGTVQWSWGLDNNGDGSSGSTADVRMQQATVNLFADMGVQPATLNSGLVPATKSTDITPPTAAITSPSGGGSVPYGTPLTITGTATDAGGGVVGAVEVSVDGGQSWHPATGRSPWSYVWSPWSLSGTATVLARAIDDSLNMQATPTSVNFNVTGGPSCPCSLWTPSTTPATAAENDNSAVELGVKFRSDVAGYVTAVRFYKGSTNTGTHTGSLWSQTGTRLATVTFTNETPSGWQQANFPSPVLISANTTYVISYYAPNGNYADDEPYFRSSYDKPPLHAPSDQVVGGNGVFQYNVGGGFPTGTFSSGNYWVDLVFVPSTPWSISGTVSNGAGASVSLTGPTSATVTVDSSGNYSFAGVQNGSYTVTPSLPGISFAPSSATVTINSASVSGVTFAGSILPTFTVSGTVAGLAGATVTLSGDSSGSTTTSSSGAYSFNVPSGMYTVTPSMNGYNFSPPNQAVSVANANVSGINFTPTQASSIWNPSAVPGTPSAADPSSVELGVRFQSSVPGFIVGIRFYKGSGNTGTHIGNLWSTGGTNLASVTFTTETETGWQQALFASPVPIAANTPYIASYFAPSGGYAADLNYFATTGVSNPPLQALADGGTAANGLYRYGSGSGFPVNTYQSTNYWVDVVFSPGPSYKISGTIAGGAGATVALTGSASGTATADGSGNYSFNGLGNGSYTVTPSQTGTVFTPASQNVTIAGADVTGINFTASPAPRYSISGTITGGAGATVTLSGAASGSQTADSSGRYTFLNLLNGSYTVTPSQTGMVFIPASRNVTVSGADSTGIDFAPAPRYSISGAITAGAGATVTLSGAASATQTADSSGAYNFSNLLSGSYTVTPSGTGLAFTPTNRPVTVTNANVGSVNFVANTVATYSISGTITGGAGATVTLSGAASASTTANGSGGYIFSGLVSGSYTVTPNLAGSTFSPVSSPVTISAANISGINFTQNAPLVIDVQTWKDQSSASTTIASPAFSTATTNELVLAFISTDQISPTAVKVNSISGGGLTWTLVQRTNAEGGTAEIWRAFATAKQTNITVTATISQRVASSMTIVSLENVDTTGANGAGAIGTTVSASAGSGAPTASLVTTRNGSWVFGVGNDFDGATLRTLGSGQTMIHQATSSSGDTYWFQRQNNRTPSSGTTVTINDTAPTQDSWNLTICEVLPKP